jgi:hypothetical protein
MNPADGNGPGLEPPIDEAAFDYLIESRGWVVFRGCLAADRLAALRVDLDRLYDHCRAVQTKNGVAANMEGTAHHLAGYGTSLDTLLDDFPLYDWVERYFAGKFVIATYSASVNPPASRAYLMKAHRDTRSFTGDYRLMLNMLIMLDDFTEENGATVLLPGSHRVAAAPPTALFEHHARPIYGTAGDIILFNSLVYHSASTNRGNARRRALTICLSRPWLKPQIDFPRFLSPEAQAKLSPRARQLLGFNARVAASLDETYQPAENWTFRADQV